VIIYGNNIRTSKRVLAKMKHSVREPAEKASAERSAVASFAGMELLAHQRSTGVAEAAPAPTNFNPSSEARVSLCMRDLVNKN